MKPLIINSSSQRIPRKYLERWVALVFRQLAKRSVVSSRHPKQLVVAFLTTKECRRLNREFRGKDYATDVLSFESVDEDSLGELVICPDVVKKQAREHKLTFREEAAYLVLHGILHLLGFEHEKGGASARRMYSLQDAIFGEIDKLRL